LEQVPACTHAATGSVDGFLVFLWDLPPVERKIEVLYGVVKRRLLQSIPEGSQTVEGVQSGAIVTGNYCHLHYMYDRAHDDQNQRAGEKGNIAENPLRIKGLSIDIGSRRTSPYNVGKLAHLPFADAF
jgi:hypothetical protein